MRGGLCLGDLFSSERTTRIPFDGQGATGVAPRVLDVGLMSVTRVVDTGAAGA
jgi:hypothetical protein